jgi:isoquinoline 1-oxidoreductase alpha subunit
MAKLTINGESVQVDATDDTPLLWVIRDHLNMTGTKYSCGMGLCGACTVHMDGEAIRSCSTPLSAAAGKSITTIEGLATDVGKAVQTAWVAEEVVQCGYCQSGQIMQATALLTANPSPSDQEIVDAMNGVVCRCGTYQRVKSAIRQAAKTLEA